MSSSPESSPHPNLTIHKTLDDFHEPSDRRARQHVHSEQKKQTLYLGIATRYGDNNELFLVMASHDGTYSIDFHESRFETEAGSTWAESREQLSAALTEFILDTLKGYEEEHSFKYVGAGLNQRTFDLSPQLASRLWRELDIVPLVFDNNSGLQMLGKKNRHVISLDEEADSLARKGLKQFGPAHQPRLFIETDESEVEVDCSKRAVITMTEDYKEGVQETTWDAMLEYAQYLKDNNIKIAFFNSTPQGGGVALMRHALIRFFRTVGVKASWYVPQPKPEVFSITKGNHNILQHVAHKDARLTEENVGKLDEWARNNAARFWTGEKGPLAKPREGGADIIVVDDPQMPSLVKIAKEQDPNRPVIFRSHIQVRADLADTEGTPASEVWNWIWGNVKDADVFISHPVREFVPKSVPPSKVGYFPATTDWLDGLNKPMRQWDIDYYMHEFNTECFKNNMATLDWPNRKYIVQIARFDPAKGIPDVLKAYAHLRRDLMAGVPRSEAPQLVIAGHGASDDTDTERIFNDTIDRIDDRYPDLKHDIVVLRVGPTDQILNALLSSAHVALQLSTREGFEVKVSEALHKGKPIIATRAGGIPLQVADGKAGFLVQPGAYKDVACHLLALFTDDALYARMSAYAASHVSDEVGTVGNALGWLYLAAALHKAQAGTGEVLTPECRWVNDMAREDAGMGYREDEVKLPRSDNLDLRKPDNRK